MNDNKDEKLPTVSFYPCIILAVIASVSFVVINPVFGIIAGVLAWLSYRKTRKENATQQKASPEAVVNEGTQKLIGTLITEQETQNQKPFEDPPCRIKRGSLPVHVHNILDEMEITTWLQLTATCVKCFYGHLFRYPQYPRRLKIGVYSRSFAVLCL